MVVMEIVGQKTCKNIQSVKFSHALNVINKMYDFLKEGPTVLTHLIKITSSLEERSMHELYYD